jgi:hypothetical protein
VGFCTGLGNGGCVPTVVFVSIGAGFRWKEDQWDFIFLHQFARTLQCRVVLGRKNDMLVVINEMHTTKFQNVGDRVGLPWASTESQFHYVPYTSPSVGPSRRDGCSHSCTDTMASE